jgi:hypothetical protein
MMTSEKGKRGRAELNRKWGRAKAKFLSSNVQNMKIQINIYNLYIPQNKKIPLHSVPVSQSTKWQSNWMPASRMVSVDSLVFLLQ